MSAVAEYHLILHRMIMAMIDLLGVHLVIASVLSASLLAVSFLVRDARVRRAVSLTALLVFLVPMPDLLPARGIETFQVSALGFSAAEGTIAASSPAPSTAQVDPLCVGAVLWLAMASLLITRTVASLGRRGADAAELSAAIVDRLNLPEGADVRVVDDAAGARVSGFLRPVIEIPGRVATAEDHEELRAVVLHELAHVRQKDNLWGMVTALLTSLLWFHPLVWLAALRFRAASELACDAAVLDAGVSLETYLESLRKLVASSPVERRADVAFGGGSLKERIRMMKTSNGRISRTAARVVVVVVACMTLGAGLTLRAMVGSESGLLSPMSDRDSVNAYRLAHQIVPLPDGTLQGDFVLLDPLQRGILAEGRVVFERGKPTLTVFTTEAAPGEQQHFTVDLDAEAPVGRIPATVTLRRPEEHFQRRYHLNIEASPEPVAPITLELNGARLSEVLESFARLLGADLIVAAGAGSERVTISFESVPWDDALDQVLLGRGMGWRKMGDVLLVFDNVRQERADGDDVVYPVVLERVDPNFTAQARAARVSGTVIVEATIGEAGEVLDVRVVKALPFGLDQSAVEAIRQWKFAPGTKNGLPAAMKFYLVVNFGFDDE